MTNVMTELIGKTVVGVFIDSSNDNIVFVTDKGLRVQYTTYGDCCSSTWIEAVTGVEALLGNTILSIEQKDTIDGDSENDYNYIQVYSYDLLTNFGRCNIEFRNSSNGYYGGSLDYVRTSTEHAFSLDGWKEITEDWKA